MEEREGMEGTTGTPGTTGTEGETVDKVLAEMLSQETCRCLAAIADPSTVRDYLETVADRIEYAIDCEREMLKANIARVKELEGLLGGAADTILEAAIRQKKREEGGTAAARQDGDGEKGVG